MDAQSALPHLPSRFSDVVFSEVFLLPDPRFQDKAFDTEDVSEQLVFALMTAKDAMDGRFPLNGTFFQTNELFVIEGPSFYVPVSLLSASPPECSIVRVYFGTSVSRITLGMGMAEVSHLFNDSYVCIRNFDVESKMSTKLHPFLSP